MDKIIWKHINSELKRQQNSVELIASENFVSEEVLKATGTILTNKYAEGYPNKRYYGGCEFIDEIETLAIERVKKLFNCNFANVQSHSGSSANYSAYLAVLQQGDTVLAMNLDAGGHLTHGHTVNFSGKTYKFIHYGVDEKSELINMNAVKELALKYKPKLIVAGASNYSRIIDFKKFGEISKQVGALLMIDMAHIAGLIASGLHPSPFPYADIVTSTTHKTLRGPRGAIILSNNEEIAKKIDKAVFPGSQGGPLEHVIAAKAIAFQEALESDFKKYSKQVIDNAKAFSKYFIDNGKKIISNGTDNHLFTIDVFKSYGLSGKEAEEILAKVNITANKNVIPFDKKSPNITSGLRLGTPAMTTRGFKTKEFIALAKMIDSLLIDSSEKNIKNIDNQVVNLLSKFPIYKNVKY